MQPRPGAALEVVEAEFLLHLLMGLLAHPARLDGGCQRNEAGRGRQVGQVVFGFPLSPALAHDPHLLTRHVLGRPAADLLGRAVGHPHPAGPRTGL